MTEAKEKHPERVILCIRSWAHLLDSKRLSVCREKGARSAKAGNIAPCASYAHRFKCRRMVA